MKDHYINILLFALPLNILVYNQRNYYITPRHTETNRSLCECELYSPTNYDSDPEMKRVMQQFVDRTTQRFHEYDERMKTTRQKCREQCDKEIQKIILKDKLEKQMEQHFDTLQTDIQSDAIPTCVCEKSLADKVEKNCMKCTQNLGGIVAPSSGVLAGIAEGALYAWKPTAIAAAMELAKQAGATAGLKAGNTHGMNIVIHYLKGLKVDTLKSGIFNSFVNNSHYTEVTGLVDIINTQMNEVCSATYIGTHPICVVRNALGLEAVPGKAKVEQIDVIRRVLNEALEKATSSANAKATQVAADKTAEFKIANVGAVESTYGSCQTAIIASIVAIVVIVLIMVIIYLILRYRRKKKMKKKLQYIKLLEE
ncbi:hypothetical protein PFFVO_05940 [Plasmodium falciparum Vietnam Oak-Knoll (FVO)]|uniref:Surface antigen n=1 Tax=Plasmodium falciparum Vietnam Oak-Knoll (FVO) TaxID=1036723 RepID=A0A024UY33_PLAFA|nr:hypothetical protein PFFVO_05940 [Plasmodium falciparum Vietnam Oak-Knoll (FVO)]